MSNLFCGGSHTLTQIAPFACHNAPQVCHTWQLANLWVVMVVGGNIATSPTPPCGLPHACPTRVSWAIARDGKIGNKGVGLGQNRPQKWIPCEFLHHISGTHFFTTTPMPKSCAGCKLESRKLWRVCTSGCPQRVNNPSLDHMPPHHMHPPQAQPHGPHPRPKACLHACYQGLQGVWHGCTWDTPLCNNPLRTGAEYTRHPLAFGANPHNFGPPNIGGKLGYNT